MSTSEIIPEMTYLVTDDEDDISNPENDKYDRIKNLEKPIQKIKSKYGSIEIEPSILEIDSSSETISFKTKKHDPEKDTRVFTSLLNIQNIKNSRGASKLNLFNENFISSNKKI